MATRLDESTLFGFESRVRSLRADTRPRWGKMSVDQMLWHLNQAVALSLGHRTLGPGFPPLPPLLLKFAVLNLPWIKGAPTHPDFVARTAHDFDAERTRLIELLHEAAAKPLSDAWPSHQAFGAMTGAEATQLIAKHLDHHLRQFGV